MAVTAPPSAAATAITIPKQRGADRHALRPPVLPPADREPVGHFLAELFRGGVVWGLLLVALATIPTAIVVIVTDAMP